MYLERLYLLTTTKTVIVKMMIMMTIAMVTMEVETAMTMGLGVEPLGFVFGVGGIVESEK